MNVLYVCNDHAYFEAHRRWLADEAERQGMTVRVACGDVRTDERGFGPVAFPLHVERHRLNVRSDLALAVAILKAARATRADVVHLITIKPVLVGLLALWLAPSVRRVVATFPGLGRLFDPADASPKARLRRRLVLLGLKIGLAPSRVMAVFETEADRTTLVDHGAAQPERAFHIAGAGVDPGAYRLAPLPDGRFTVLFAGRLLRAKGVPIVADAARLVAAAGHDVRFIIAGGAQEGDPDGLDAAELAALSEDPHVDLLGAVPIDQMPDLLAKTHVVVLPTSYQEGVPRILIEAGSVGRPAIISDNKGCKAFVEHGTSGLVLESLSAEALAAAVIRLAADRGLLERLASGAAARVSEGGFSQHNVAMQTLALYQP
jgi:glycosyltransferase involved in cell wall biosynthesis